MNTQVKKVVVPEFINGLQREYERAACGQLNSAQEALFAIQQVTKSDAAMDAVQKNPQSLRDAYLQAAACGISLNPINKEAYLIPRKKQIVLELSYQGLKRIAEESGAITSCKAEIVYAADRFRSRGPFAVPEHDFDPFAPTADRGPIRGVYCVAKLPDGNVMTDFMNMDQILQVRNKSMDAEGDYSPWKHWFDQMVLKTSVKRASKSWPRTGGKMDRLDGAIHYLNTVGGEGVVIQGEVEQPSLPLLTDSDVKLIESNSDFVDWVGKVEQRAVQQRSWQAAEEYVRERLNTPEQRYQLAYAIDRLVAAKATIANAA